MPEANTATAAHPGSDGILAALTATLGGLAPNNDDEMEDVHFDGLRVLRSAAPLLPVRSAADAALALSLVARIHDDLGDDNELRRELTVATAILPSWPSCSGSDTAASAAKQR
jgi:hypothetical protein